MIYVSRTFRKLRKCFSLNRERGIYYQIFRRAAIQKLFVFKLNQKYSSIPNIGCHLCGLKKTFGCEYYQPRQILRMETE